MAPRLRRAGSGRRRDCRSCAVSVAGVPSSPGAVLPASQALGVAERDLELLAAAAAASEVESNHTAGREVTELDLRVAGGGSRAARETAETAALCGTSRER